MCFFIDVAIKLAVLVSWRTTPVSLCCSSELPQKCWHHSYNNKNWLKQPQSHFHYVILHKSYHFLLFWCIICMATPDILSSSKISTTWPVFPGYFSVPYDYGARNLDEFHLVYYCWPKVQNEGNIYKKLNNCMS